MNLKTLTIATFIYSTFYIAVLTHYVKSQKINKLFCCIVYFILNTMNDKQNLEYNLRPRWLYTPVKARPYNVDVSIVDQVWFQLHCVPGVMFGACYILPSDSTYFNPQAFGKLHEKMVDHILSEVKSKNLQYEYLRHNKGSFCYSCNSSIYISNIIVQ